MSQISKQTLDTTTQKRIYDIFTHVLATATEKEDITALLFDFLTPTERIMLPKKLCIAYLLIKKYDQRTISHYMNVSFTTITNVSTVLKHGGKGYRTMIDRIEKNEGFTNMLEGIESGIRAYIVKSRSNSLPSTIDKGGYNSPHSMAERTPDIL